MHPKPQKGSRLTLCRSRGLQRLFLMMTAAVLLICQTGLSETETGTESRPVPESYASSLLARLGVSYAECYLLVSVGGTTYLPIPLLSEGEYRLRQGEDTENVIHVTCDSIVMASSTCENQDCVKQGVVTMENRENRILGNLIICLPNQVQIALYSYEETEALLCEVFAGLIAEGNE